MANPQTSTRESLSSLVAFWLVAFAAAGLFAAVLIAPKWQHTELLLQRVGQLNTQCTYLSESNEYLQRVGQALRHDPEFMQEIARSEFDYRLPDEQILTAPVTQWQCPQPARPEPAPDRWWDPVLDLFASDLLVRRLGLFTAAMFTVVGLAFFKAGGR